MGASLIALALATAVNTGALSSSPPFDIWNIIQFGVIGAGFVCVIKRKWIVPEWTLRQAEERHALSDAAKDKTIAALESQVERLQGVIQSEALPALLRSTEVISKYNDEAARARWAAGAARGDES